jgi:RHS repeat-associated protein
LVTGTINYNYDPEYRLLTANYGTVTANNEAYSYDKVGNRLTSTLGALVANATSRYYNYNTGNRLTDIRIGSAIGTVYESYGYDDNGSMTGISGNRSMTLTWDANNRPTIINGSTFNYDPSGYRIKKSGTTNNNYYLEGENLEAIYDNTGTVQAKYLRGSVIDEIINGYQLDANGKLVNYTYHHDALQSVLGQSGHEGSILAKQTYSSFGSMLSQTGLSNNTQKYTGREIDKETGLYNYRNRIYDPTIGRFISEDLMRFSAGINFYTYCFNNPVICNDPSGFYALVDDVAFAGIGSIIGVGLQGATDLLRGDLSTKGEYTSAAIQGGAAGIGLLYAPATGWISPFVAGSFGAAIGNVAKQGIDNKGLNNFNLGSLKQDTAIGAATSLIPFPGLGGLTGITGGRNSLAAIGRSTITKLRKGTIQNVSAKTALKSAVGLSVYQMPGSVAGQAISTAIDPLISAVNSTMNSINSQFNPGVGSARGTISVDLLGFGDSASGGYVLYPSKPNNNMAQSVYRK